MKNLTKKKSVVIVVGILLAVGIFYGGFAFGSSKAAAPASGTRNQNFSGARMMMQGNRANLVIGNIISKDDTSITISMPTGGSRIVFISPTTAVMKSVAGSLDDLKVGNTVTVQGNTNSANGITADSIQIRQTQ